MSSMVTMMGVKVTRPSTGNLTVRLHRGSGMESCVPFTSFLNDGGIAIDGILPLEHGQFAKRRPSQTALLLVLSPKLDDRHRLTAGKLAPLRCRRRIGTGSGGVVPRGR